MAEAHDQLYGVLAIGALCCVVVLIAKLAHKLSSFLWLGFGVAIWSLIFTLITDFVKGTLTTKGIAGTLRFMYDQRDYLLNLVLNKTLS